MEEVWKDIENYEGYFQVSNLGRIRTIDRYVRHNYGGLALKKGKILKLQKHKNGYLAVCLSKENTRHIYLVHRLVCNAFIPNPNNYPQINHIDENKENNNVNNLEWCTAAYNVEYSNTVSIIQYDKKENPLCEYTSGRLASRITGISHGNIIRCLKGERKTAGGFIWKYKMS